MPRASSLRKGAATNAGIVWKRPPSELARDFEVYGEALLELSLAGAEDIAGEMERYAKANHPWQNRTGAAERGLHAEAKRSGDEVEMRLSHGVPYGVYLETMQGGRFAIILPTIERFQHELLTRLHNLAVDAARQSRRS